MADANVNSDLDTSTGKIKEWRSIITLLVFIFTNVNVLFPFHIPIYIPRVITNAILDILSASRVILPRKKGIQHDQNVTWFRRHFRRFDFPMNFVTAPLIADLFLLAILAIGREEVKGGTIGANNIHPYDIMIFFITLAYIAISIDASGLIRYLAFKVLQKAGKVGHRLFLYLYVFFFILGSFIGNDPIILSGTAFLAYMTRVSSNIIHPRAWIHTQFAVANIASAILVSSNPTNLVLAGAFDIRFIRYTANMIVPVIVTAIVLFPFLLYIVFADESLIPLSIKMHELSEEAKAKKPVNPNIPHGRGAVEEEERDHINDEQGKLLSLEEIMNPFLDKSGAAFGGVIMGATLITVLTLNAVSQNGTERPVFWVTLPAAVVMFIWDIGFGWYHRKETREIARRGREEVERAQIEREIREEDESASLGPDEIDGIMLANKSNNSPSGGASSSMMIPLDEKDKLPPAVLHEKERTLTERVSREMARRHLRGPTTLTSIGADSYKWAQETFPSVTAVVAHLPFALVPFAFSMFVLVQALVTKGWVQVFAHGWDHWVKKTGTVGAIGGMGFVSVILCNFAGTNIGTSILLSRVIQSWQDIHTLNQIPITDRTFWGTVYAMALGVNYGAFSTAFSASLAGLLWRDILSRKHIRVRSLDFARVNLPIIAISMAVGCAVLVGEVYITRDNNPYNMKS